MLNGLLPVGMQHHLLRRPACATILLLTLVPASWAQEGRSWRALHEKHEHGGKDEAEPIHYAMAEPTACRKGRADIFRCKRVNLLGHVDLSDVAAGIGNDVWGWYDRRTRREFALMGHSVGTSFVDVTDPTEPILLGTLPTQTVATGWRDVKTYRHWALVVADSADDHGVQFFNLRRLRSAGTGETFEPDLVYDDIGSAHNLFVNEETAFAYVVGSSTCWGGLHMIDLQNAQEPTFAGCYSDDGYTHDVQCVVYRGPDEDYQGHEVCFASNEDSLTLVDVSDKSAPRMISRSTYDGVSYTHQAWLTEDHAWLFVDDEGDEQTLPSNTRTLVWDVSDLDRPTVAFEHLSNTPAIDHNQYVLGDLVFQANYTRGLQILRFGDLAAGELVEVGRFDTHPESNEPTFNGAWSVYPYLPSGTVLVNDMNRGLFVLSLRRLR